MPSMSSIDVYKRQAPAAVEALLNGLQRLGTDGVAARLVQALHQAGHFGIAAGDVVEQALEVRGH